MRKKGRHKPGVGRGELHKCLGTNNVKKLSRISLYFMKRDEDECVYVLPT